MSRRSGRREGSAAPSTCLHGLESPLPAAGRPSANAGTRRHPFPPGDRPRPARRLQGGPRVNHHERGLDDHGGRPRLLGHRQCLQSFQETPAEISAIDRSRGLELAEETAVRGIEHHVAVCGPHDPAPAAHRQRTQHFSVHGRAVAMKSRKIRRINSAMLSLWSSAKCRNLRPWRRGIGRRAAPLPLP